MDVVGYFLALYNLQALGGYAPYLDDVSVKMANLYTLANYLKTYPDFSIEDFKEDGINQVGDVGMYLSNNLREFCLNGRGNPFEEGVIFIITYKVPGDTGEDDENVPNLANHSFLFSKDGLSEDLIRPILQELNKQDSGQNKFLMFREAKGYTNK